MPSHLAAAPEFLGHNWADRIVVTAASLRKEGKKKKTHAEVICGCCSPLWDHFVLVKPLGGCKFMFVSADLRVGWWQSLSFTVWESGEHSGHRSSLRSGDTRRSSHTTHTANTRLAWELCFKQKTLWQRCLLVLCWLTDGDIRQSVTIRVSPWHRVSFSDWTRAVWAAGLRLTVTREVRRSHVLDGNLLQEGRFLAARVSTDHPGLLQPLAQPGQVTVAYVRVRQEVAGKAREETPGRETKITIVVLERVYKKQGWRPATKPAQLFVWVQERKKEPVFSLLVKIPDSPMMLWIHLQLIRERFISGNHGRRKIDTDRR